MSASLAGDRIGPFVTASGALHLLAAGALWIGGAWSDPTPPLINPDDVMMVTMAMPKSPDAMPHRAERAPRPAAAPPRPDPIPAPPDPSPPPDELATPSPAPPDPSPPSEPSPADLDAQRRRLMDMLDEDDDAPLGTEDRQASSPDGIEGASGSDASALGDPAYAAYIGKVRQLFLPEFRPIPALKGQGLSTHVFVRTDDHGRIVQRRVARSSGNPSWDQAALAAVHAVDTLPIPPDDYRARMKAGYTIEFSDEP